MHQNFNLLVMMHVCDTNFSDQLHKNPPKLHCKKSFFVGHRVPTSRLANPSNSQLILSRLKSKVSHGGKATTATQVVFNLSILSAIFTPILLQICSINPLQHHPLFNLITHPPIMFDLPSISPYYVYHKYQHVESTSC